MSSNRYGQIWHGDHHHINIRFPSTEARLKFQEEFDAYHASHDHDGDIPIFKDVTLKDLKLGTGSRSPEDLVKGETDDTYRITIDGYHWSEIRSYQNNEDLSGYNWYRPPTCCVPPTIVIDSEYVSSADLKRHPLSAIFGDMPDSDFQSLLSSVESDGFIEPVIRIYEGQILDGWHRYRAAQELGIIRKLRFREWNEDSHRDGDPKVFVLARNIERRHLNAAQRAQIAVTFNERFGMGRPTDLQKVHQNGELKTRSELATEANVGTSTIDRAVQVEKAGRAEEVISGEKSAGEVIAEETVKSLWEQINPAISAWKKEREGVGHASKSMFIKATLRWEGLPSDTETDVKVLKELLNLLTTKETNILEELIRKQLDGKSLWDDASVGVETVEQETEQPSQTAEEREANKLLKQKKQAAKLLWDTRKQASKDWLGDEDNDLTTYTDLDALEKAFAENNPSYATAFKLAMQRTSETSFNIMWDKIVSDDVDLDVLQAQVRAVQTYAADIRQWQRPDWSPDTNWILPLIEAKKAKASSDTDERKTLLEKVKAEVPKWRERYKQSGKKESELVNRASLSALIHVYRNWENASGAAMEEGAATAEELEQLLKLLKDDSYVFIYRLRDYLRETDEEVSEQMATEEAPDKEGLSEEFKRIFTLHSRFDRDIVDCEALGETYHLHVDDVESAMDDFQSELAALEHAVRKQIEADAEMSVADIADRVEVSDIEVVETTIARIQLDDANPKPEPKAAVDIEAVQRDIVKAREKADAEGGMVSFRPIANKYGIDAEEVGRIAAAIQGASSRETSEEAPDTDTDLEKALESLMTAVDQFDVCFAHDTDFESDDYSKLCDLAAVEFECDRDMLYQIVFDEDCPEHFGVSELTQWETIVRQMLKSVKSNADWVATLTESDESEADKVKTDTETTEAEIDLYHDLNHLRVLQNTLSPLLESLGADDMSYHHKDILTADLYDVFLQYKEVPTEKEMIVALLDLAHSILFEEIPND